MVAKGFTQRYGINYLETLASVVKLTSLRIILALATACDYEVEQRDIKSASLLAKLVEEIYKEMPEGWTVAVFPTGQVGQAAAKPSLAYGNSLGPGLARAYRLCRA